MGKSSVMYICSHCDAQYPKWSGRCLECGKWGTLKESVATESPLVKKTASRIASSPATVMSYADLKEGSIARIKSTGFPSERLFPAGIALGSLSLITGEPGAGKSTLCLQLAQNFSAAAKTLYITAEESAVQTKERGSRIGTFGMNFFIAESVQLEEILATIQAHKPQVVCIDSIQTIVSSQIEGSAGSVNQVRAIAAQLLQFARAETIAILLIGHVTKDGSLAGPKSLEHLVDTVYYLESDHNSAYRLLRTFKNRYGHSGTVIVMQLGSKGLTEVTDASRIFIRDYHAKPGSVLTVTVIDDQLFFIEVQALVSKSSFGFAKRTASGFSRSRLELLLAIIKKQLHVDCDAYDVFINIAGGFRVTEPAMDLAVVLAVLSSLKETTIPEKTIVFGEVGLSGEIRQVKETSVRLKEIEKNRFSSVYLPPLSVAVTSAMKLHAYGSLTELVKHLKW